MDWSNFGIANGLYVVIIGFGMVFLILCIISFILGLFSFAHKLSEKNKANKKAKISETKNVVINSEPEKKPEDDLELVAVITAAIAASMSTTSDNIIVHSIRKTSNWNKTAISENLKNFYQ